MSLIVLSLVETVGAQTFDRLPTAVSPEKYELNLHVDPTQDRFSGRVLIRVKVVEKTDRVVLHARNLDIQEVLLDGAKIPAERLHVDEQIQTLTIEPSRTLLPGPMALEFHYSAKYNRQMAGLYLSTAKHAGKEERYAFTQLEATDARRMFPCFDEPAFKARFHLVVTAPAQLTVLSNMPAAKTARAGGLQTVSFEETPLMSTYLLALAVARLAPISAVVGKTKISVWTRPEDSGQAAFALEIATQALTRLNAYFDLPYELPKLDLVAVPDFSAGAMENWGAIFFRDSTLLFDPKLSSAFARRRVASVVAHEIVHQWFGDLVTMKWWNDVWLNEAFATWLATKIVDQWRPEWLAWHNYEQGTLNALSVDALRNTRPVSSAAASTAEIDAQFDKLSYQKGGALLRMYENFLGEEKFRQGLRQYVARYRNGNTAAIDLWRELESAADRSLAKPAMDWITLPGYPLVHISPVSENNHALRIAQRRFSAHGATSDPTLWDIPLVIKFKDQTGIHTHRLNLKERETTIALPAEGRVEWIYANQGQTGFYRCAFDPSLLKPLSAAAFELDPLERIGLLNDLWVQAHAGLAPLSDFLDFLTALRSDGSRLALESVADSLGTLDDHLIAPADRPLLADLAGDLLSPHWKALGWTPGTTETDETRLARTAVLLALGRVAQPPALLQEAQRRLARYLDNPASVEPALVYPLLSLGAKTGNAGRFRRYREALKKVRTPEEKINLLTALADFRLPAATDSLLAMLLTSEIRGQDFRYPLPELLANPATQERTLLFLLDHWREIVEKMGGFTSANRLVAGLSRLWNDDDRDRIVRFFSRPENRADQVRRGLDQSLEQIELNVNFKKTARPALSDWLNARARTARRSAQNHIPSGVFSNQ